VLTYTTFGGMFSVAILDFVQMAVSMGGLLFIAWTVSGKVGGGATAIIDHAAAAGKLDFFPPPDPWLWLTFIGTWLTMMLGSIPQQDVFQRVTSAKSAKIALIGSILGASIYFCFTFVPMFIAYSATLIHPEQFAELMKGRHATDPAHAGAAAHAAFRPGAVLRRRAIGHHELLFGHAAGAFGHLRRERDQGLLPEMGDHQFLRVMRGLPDRVHLHGARLRAEVRFLDFQDGRKRLQGHPGWRLRPARRRHFLAQGNNPGRTGRDLRRACCPGC
jgi:SSS family solute:Na+ symporter